MVGCLARKRGAHIGNPKFTYQKFSKLKGACRKILSFLKPGVACENFRVKLLHHGNTRCRRTDDDLGTLKDIEGTKRSRTGDVPMPRVEGWLTATGLGVAEFYLMSQSF